MRMARLKVYLQGTKDKSLAELITPPDQIVLTHYDEFVKVDTRFDRHKWTLDMPLDEALAELNAAMNYDENLELEYLRKKLSDSEK